MIRILPSHYQLDTRLAREEEKVRSELQNIRTENGGWFVDERYEATEPMAAIILSMICGRYAHDAHAESPAATYRDFTSAAYNGSFLGLYVAAFVMPDPYGTSVGYSIPESPEMITERANSYLNRRPFLNRLINTFTNDMYIDSELQVTARVLAGFILAGAEEQVGRSYAEELASYAPIILADTEQQPEA